MRDDWVEKHGVLGSLFVGGVVGALISKTLDILIASYYRNPVLRQLPEFSSGIPVWNIIDGATILVTFIIVAAITTFVIAAILRHLMK